MITDFRRVVPQGSIILIGNYTDLNRKRIIPLEAAQMVEERWNTPYYETYSTSGKTVDDPFTKVAELALANVQATRH